MSSLGSNSYRSKWKSYETLGRGAQEREGRGRQLHCFEFDLSIHNNIWISSHIFLVFVLTNKENCGFYPWKVTISRPISDGICIQSTPEEWTVTLPSLSISKFNNQRQLWLRRVAGKCRRGDTMRLPYDLLRGILRQRKLEGGDKKA